MLSRREERWMIDQLITEGEEDRDQGKHALSRTFNVERINNR